MSLRTRILSLFIIAAVVPLLGLGAVEYARATRALESMIAAQNARVAERVATAVGSRAALLESDLRLLAENEETQRWMTGLARGRGDSAAAREADRFVRNAWSSMGTSYAALSYRDRAEQPLYQIGAVPTPFERAGGAMRPLPVSHPVLDQRDGTPIGTVTLHPALAAMVPLEVLATGFGERGHGMVIDRASGRFLYHPDPRWEGRSVDSVIADGEWNVSKATLAERTGRFRYRSGDTLRVASFVSLASPAWTVVVSGSVDEFAQPFAEDRLWSLGAFLSVTVLATLLFAGMLRRTTRSLEQLTAATAVVGRGNLDPVLPSQADGEVGRLTSAFSEMLRQVREMVAEIESSRQMAVLGAFAAQLSHEVRNPLTSIKLNLQKLERLARDGQMPDKAALPLELSLAEVARLDTVVRGVLQLGRTRPEGRERVSLRHLLRATLATIGEQASAQGVRIEPMHERTGEVQHAGDDVVDVDPAGVRGALLNVLLNALHAMPSGGVLSVTEASDGKHVTLSVRDTGAGVPEAARGELFRPFYTTRDGGTGLGLPLARRAVEESGGTLTLADPQPPTGAEFVFMFPIVTGATIT